MLIFLLAYIPSAFAFGLGDLVGATIQIGAKLGGAVIGKTIDSAKDAMRDPEAEAAEKREDERKMLETFAKAQREIEDREGLTPLQRERFSMALVRQYEQMNAFRQFVEAAEARQRAERDNLFTAGGLLGVATEAVRTSPSFAIAQADMMVKAGIPQAQGRAAIAGADAIYGASSGQKQIQAALTNGAVDAAKIAVTQPLQAVTSVEVIPPPAVHDASGAQSATIQVDASIIQPPAVRDDAFAQDRGKHIQVEFVGSPVLTQKLQSALARLGYTLSDPVGKPDVIYRIEGEFVIQETRRHKGLSLGAGKILEAVEEIAPPEEKLAGKIGLGVSKLFLGLAAAQGKSVPENVTPPDQVMFKQDLLLVIARQADGEREARVSVIKRAEQGKIQARSLAQEAATELFERLGLKIDGMVAAENAIALSETADK